MKIQKSILQRLSRLWSLVIPFSPLAAALEAAPTPEWPRVIYRDGVTNTIYQPQLQSWDYATLKAISAVAVQAKGARQPTFGTVQIQTRTLVDRAQRTVAFEELQIVQDDFPSAGEKSNNHLATLRSLLPKGVKEISLDRLEASLAILEARQGANGQPLRNDPPVIIFSSKPAMLVPVDGPPVYRQVETYAVDRIFNSRALILRDKAGTHYLHLFDGYVQAPGLGGPWTIANRVPDEVTRSEWRAVAASQVDLLAGQDNPQTKQKPSLKSTPVPVLYVTGVPTELIVLQGEAQWTPVPATQLLCATNTASHVFKALADQKTYVLISGRWFRASSLDGPWEYVSAASLPEDFAKIPDDSTQENVKASVPGTRQAREAVIANGIPQTIKVERRRAKIDPPLQFDGPVQLKSIDGTSLQYIANCATPVIQSDATTWYACQNGVWFVSGAASGRWTVATNVPAAIYSIPPSSPIYYVTFSRIYNFDANYVWIGTTPGYYGTVLGPDGTVVYGTGYAYPPYLGTTVYVSYPVTYGYGCNPCWTPWAGWAFGFAVGWAMADDWYWWCYCPPAPYWGPYYGWCYGSYYNAYGGITAWGPYGWAGTSGYIYHQYGAWSGVSRAAAGYNAWTGNQWATTYGRAYNSTTGTRAVGQRGAVENVYSGNYAYGGRGAAYNENTGAAAAGRKITVGNENTGNQGTAGRATVYNPNTGNTTKISGAQGENGGVINVNGHVIAGNDGNYYRPDGQGGWQQVTKPSGTPGAGGAGGSQPWTAVQPSAANQERVQSLNNEYNARQMGAQRQQSYQMNQPAFRGGGGGGGRRR